MAAFLTSAAGHRSAEVPLIEPEGKSSVTVDVHHDRSRQTVLGIGGSLTQASAAALSTVSKQQRQSVLEALFGPAGCAYSMIRTHVASCDFSTSSYTYAPEADPSLAGFSVEVDEQNGHLDLIRDALAVHGAAFKIVASPWTAPPWMKDNGAFYDSPSGRGGRLRPEHHETYARYFVKYLQAYAAKGVNVWGLTPVNEPHGNRGTWESMEMEPDEQAAFVRVLGATLRQAKLDTKVLVYDQNRRGAFDFAAPMLGHAETSPFIYGTAVHWYDSTYKVYEEELERLHAAFPDHAIVQTEGCIDNVFGKGKDRGPNAPLPWWQDDAWYWRKEATDWGWDWAPNPEADHPKYSPAFRYARDIVGCLGHWVTGWIDWNIVLDKRGGPNHVGNFCLAPILVDGATDTVYYTPLFHILRQVSRHTRPGAVVYETHCSAPGLWATALRNPDLRGVVHLFNETASEHIAEVKFGPRQLRVTVPASSLLTLTDLTEV